jgi:hypothetical protein
MDLKILKIIDSELKYYVLKQRPPLLGKTPILLVGRPRFERGTNGLKVRCSTD